MTTVALSPIVAHIVEAIEGVPDIGLVWPHDLWDRDDLRNVVVSEIDGRPTLRAWWVSGPEMTSEPEGYTGDSRRDWVFTVHGIEGLAPAYDGDPRGPGGDLLTLRDNVVAICSALDENPVVIVEDGLVAQLWPAMLPAAPAHRTFAGGLGVSHAAITVRTTAA